MTPEQYDRWYASSRGRWIGETEFRLLASELDCQQGGKVLDVGCGTGWFTCRDLHEILDSLPVRNVHF